MDNTNSATILEESIHILNHINSKLITYFKALTVLPNYGVDSETFKIINTLNLEFAIIQINSYLEEYHKYFTPNLSKLDKEYINPLYKRIKQEINLFSGIKGFRNHALAHSLRVDGRSFFLHTNTDKYVIPQKIGELILLGISIQQLTDIINYRFPGTNEKVRKLMNSKRAEHSNLTEPMDSEYLETRQLNLLNDLKELGWNK